MLRFFLKVSSSSLLQESFKVPLVARGSQTAALVVVRYRNHVGNCITPLFPSAADFRDRMRAFLDDAFLDFQHPRVYPNYVYIPDDHQEGRSRRSRST